MTMAEFEQIITIQLGYDPRWITSIRRLEGDSDASVVLTLGAAGLKIVLIENGKIIGQQG